MITARADGSYALVSIDEQARRRTELRQPHVAPLTALVEALRAEHGFLRGEIPYFDPRDGGIGARALFLLEAPGRRAVSSGFISRDNPDPSARNFRSLLTNAGIPREASVLWNIVPGYIGTGTRIRAAGRTDIEAGLLSLTRLLALLPKLKAVVLVGRKAERAASLVSRLRPEVRLFPSPHPSPLFVNNAKGNRDRILSVLREAAACLENRERAV